MVTSSDDNQRRRIASAAFLGAAFTPIAFVLQKIAWKQTFFTAGGAAACVCVLVAVGLVFQFPELIRDGSDGEGKASTMRVLSLAIVFSFCAIMLRTGWALDHMPSLANEGNWVWLVTAAIGGKAVQAYVEMNGPQPPATTGQDTMPTQSTMAPAATIVAQGTAPKPLANSSVAPANALVNGAPMNSGQTVSDDGADI